MTRAGDFWSRRKQAVEAEEAIAARKAADAETEAQKAALARQSDEEILAQFDLPDPDSIRPGDDVRGFMRAAIPERLRKRALRSLWRSNPVLACVDGLNDYDDDYTNAATDAPGVKTAYKVGKGLLKHVEALAEEARAKTRAAEADALPDTHDNAAISLTEVPESQEESDAAPASTTKVVVATSEIGEKTEPPDAVAAVPRRMRFSFETESE
ncbi:DUF3306 domain-containing protein [Thalassococcus sp. BH17M4-6]|uniref:DUF3306 domain-containing protein n=1 Tax=Thalassococcus sp. BH17M4-6 TaxID=3413148 RepID=UPI003BC41EFB